MNSILVFSFERKKQKLHYRELVSESSGEAAEEHRVNVQKPKGLHTSDTEGEVFKEIQNHLAEKEEM